MTEFTINDQGLTEAAAVKGDLPRTTTVKSEKQSLKYDQLRLSCLLLLAFTAMYATFQGIQQILLPAQVEHIDPARKIQNLAFLTMTASIMSVLGLLAGGAISDRTQGPWGRRSPWLVLASTVAVLLLIVVGSLTNIVVLAITYNAIGFCVNFYQSPLTAVLPDRVAPQFRGIVSSVMALGAPLGIILGVNFVARVSQQTAYIGLGVFLVATTWAFVLFAREDSFYKPISVGTASKLVLNPRRWASAIADLFVSLADRDFLLVFLGRALFFVCFFVVTGYMYYILQDYIGLSRLPQGDPKAAVSLLGSVQSVTWIAGTIGAGWLAGYLDRCKLFVALSSLGLGVSMLVPLLSPSWPGIIILYAFNGFFFGSYMAVDLALMSLVLPDARRAGQDMALLTVATGAPQILGPVIGGALIGLFGYNAIFIFSLITAFLGGGLVLAVKKVR